MMKRLQKLVLGGIVLTVLIFIFSQDYSSFWTKTTWSLPLSGHIFVIDPGHGGVDGGAVSKSGIVEKEISLAISFYLRDLLQQAGALVLMTRETDTDLASENAKRRKTEDLKNRLHFINERDADAFISIHLNAIPSPRWRGAQTFYNPNKSENQQMALLIQDELIRTLENTTRLAKKNQDIFILRHAEPPGILVEVGFLSNPSEAELLNTVAYQKQMAIAIYQGMLRYYSGEEMNE
jgi:N-acetylmuramoyl-L-alanine amidase